MEETQPGSRAKRWTDLRSEANYWKSPRANKIIHVCAKDKEKAWQTINWAKFWGTFYKKVISDTLIIATQFLYKGIENGVKIGDMTSNKFITNIGVR